MPSGTEPEPRRPSAASATPAASAERTGSTEPNAPTPPAAGLRQRWADRAATWSPSTRGLLWATASGLTFSVLNASMRVLTQQIDVMQSQFLRYAMGLLVLLPLVWWQGLGNYRPREYGGHFWRGAVHTAGLMLWFTALPRIPLADMTAIGFTGPIFVMIGAWLWLGEPMRWERWLATGLGLTGVFIVVGPQLSGGGGNYHLLMLASAPVFAASFLITKVLTRTESAHVILLWQSISVTLFSLPLALWAWQPISAAQWLGFVGCGVLGSAGHYCLTRSFAATDISATQTLKFLDLVWAALLGLLVFGDLPTAATLMGGVVIATATIWVARRESRHRPATARALAEPATATRATPPAQAPPPADASARDEQGR